MAGIISFIISFLLFLIPFYKRSFSTFRSASTHCRCLDEIFLTWNDSIDKFHRLLHSIIHQQQHLSSCLLTISIDKKVNYLDAAISHINGRLRTHVKHNLQIEPYSLPYISNQLISMNDIPTTSLIREALIRAAQSCATVFDFEREEYFIHWSLDLNKTSKSSYTWYDIWLEIQKFLTEFTAGELYFNPNDYDKLRRRVRQYDYKRIQMEIERRQREQKQEIWYIIYPFKNKLFTQFKQDFERFWLRCCNYDNTADLNKFNLQFIRQRKYLPRQ